MTAPALEVDGVSVRYGDTVALDDCSFALDPGRVAGLIGMNGSGKSTLFRTIMGAVKPQRGSVRIDGAPAARARARSQVGYVPQAEAVDWAFPVSVRDIVMMGRYAGLGPMRRPGKRDHVAVDGALEQVGLADLADRQIGQLSGGQRKRAFVARGIAQEATLLLLDEPFAGVDNVSEHMMVGLLRDLAAQGRTVLVSTHDLQTLPSLADQALLLLRRVIFHGSVAQALEPDQLTRAFGMEPPVGGGAR